MAQESAKRRFYDAQIRYLQAGDVDDLITGNAALKEYFRGYLQMLGTLDILSTDKFVETDDSLFFQATVKTSLGEAKVYDAWVLRDGKISHHFTGVYP